MINWPEDLVADIARRRSVLFLGAGLSKNSTNDHGERPMDWDQFIRYLAARVPAGDERDVIETCIKDGDLLTACEIARKALRPDVFKGELLSEFAAKRFNPSSVHDDIIALDSRIVITTNFDKIYDSQANMKLRGDVLVKNYYDTDLADILRRPQRCILKVHGTIDSPDRAIFTRSEYAKARTEFGHFYRLLEALFLTHTFIFIGASMRDPDFRLLLEDLTYRYSGSRPHFVIKAKGAEHPRVLEVMEGSMNLRSVEYDPSNYHKELAESLSELKDLVDDRRESLTKNTDW